VPRNIKAFRRRANAHGETTPDGRTETSGFLGRPVVIVAGLLAIAAVMFVVWLVLEAVQAKSSLEAARTTAGYARDALLKGNADDTRRWVDQTVSHAQEAHNGTHSVPWRIVAAVPWLGSPFKTGQQISDVVLGLASDVLRPSADVAAAMSPDKLLEDGRVNVVLLRDSAPRLTEIAVTASQLGDQARAISGPAYLGAVRDARNQLQDQAAEVTGLLRNADLAAQLAPTMLGADGPRTYFMAFQTNAEARGTGGLLGGFGVLRFDNGKPTVEDLGSNAELKIPYAPVDLGPDYQPTFGNTTTDYRNSNISPHFPWAAQIWKSMWQQESGMAVNGVVAIDPVALSYVLDVVGSVTMPGGEVITADNVVELTESTVYARFPTDQPARKAYLQDVANEVVKRVTGDIKKPRALLDALGKAAGEGRIAVWSSAPVEQALLEQTPLAHIVPDDDAPYAAVVINNLGGNKLDYYLRRKIEYAADGCDGDTRKSTITVTLTNGAPAHGLPHYVTALEGVGFEYSPQVPAGSNITSVTLIATKGSKLVGAVVDGRKARVFPGSERGHPTYEVQLAIPPEKTFEVKFLLNEPVTAGTPQVPIQPLVDDVEPVISVPECP